VSRTWRRGKGTEHPRKGYAAHRRLPTVTHVARSRQLPAKVLKRVQVAAEECAGVGPLNKLQVEHPGPAQHHRERPHTARPTSRRRVSTTPEVDLRLLARGGLKAHGPLRRRMPAERMDELLEDRVAASVATLA
jgi:hypothetical protein